MCSIHLCKMENMCRSYGLTFLVFLLSVAACHTMSLVENPSLTNVTCSSHAYCQVLFGDEMPLCCGDCQLTICCNDTRQIAELDLCKEEEPTGGTALGSKTLAIVIGSIIGCFVILLIANWLIKRYLCSKSSSSSARGGRGDGQPHLTSYNNATMGAIHTELPMVEPAPPYTDIHLYNKVDHGNSQPLYYKLPGEKSYYGIVSPTANVINPSVSNEVLQSEPPTYESVVEERSEMGVST